MRRLQWTIKTTIGQKNWVMKEKVRVDNQNNNRSKELDITEGES